MDQRRFSSYHQACCGHVVASFSWKNMKCILNVILVCIMCTTGCFVVIFLPCQDRVQSEHGRWPKVLAVVAAFLQIRFWPTRYGRPFRHVHIDGIGPHPRVARLRFALPLPLLQTRVGILYNCKCVLCILEGMTSLSVCFQLVSSGFGQMPMKVSRS